MYNFGVPASLTNWIDAIARVKVTFRYTENGPEGLLKGKKVYVVLTRGGQAWRWDRTLNIRHWPPLAHRSRRQCRPEDRERRDG